MSNEFWLGLFYGVIAGALPLLAYMTWDANRRVQERLRRVSLPLPRVTPEQIKAASERVMRDMRARGELPVTPASVVLSALKVVDLPQKDRA
jgi:hypothetical protein